jgi:hypothetical protein
LHVWKDETTGNYYELYVDSGGVLNTRLHDPLTFDSPLGEYTQTVEVASITDRLDNLEPNITLAPDADDYQILLSDSIIHINFSASPWTAYLPLVALADNNAYTIKNINSSPTTMYLAVNTGDTGVYFEGESGAPYGTTLEISQYNAITVVSNGTHWWIDTNLEVTTGVTVHNLGGSEHDPDTLANLNAKVSDATLIDTADSRLSDDRDPNSHGLGDVARHSGIAGTENNFMSLDFNGLPKDSTYSSSNFEASKGNTITVAESGGDYTSIATAVGAASAGDVIKVFPGTYTESAMTLTNIIVSGVDRAKVTVVASDVNNPLFTLAGGANVSDMTLSGVTNDACVYDVSGLSTNTCHDLTLKTSQEGIFAAGTGTILKCHRIYIESTITRGIYCTASGVGAVIADKIYSDATTSIQANLGKIQVMDLVSFSGTNIIYANGGRVDFHGVSVDDATNVLRADTATGKIEGFGLDIRGTTTFDILQENASAEISLFSSQMSSQKISATDISKILIDFNDTIPGDKGLTLMKELHVGTPEIGYESVFGQGDSYTRGMLVYTEDTSNVFVDESADAASASGSTFTFTGTAINNRIYVASTLYDGSDYLQTPGIKVNVTTAAVPGSGAIVAEYWNGSAWTEFNHMSTQANSQYLPYAKDVFERTGSEQIRFDPGILTDWTVNDPISPAIGTNYYWIRFTIITASITTAPVFEQFKLHTNRSEINYDGWHEYFGSARPIKVLPWDYIHLKATADTPLDQNLYALNKANDYEDLDIGGIDNSYANTALDRTGMTMYAPYDMDTSGALKLMVSFTSTGTGDFVFYVNFGITREGDTINTTEAAAPTSITAEQHLSSTITISTANQQQTEIFDIDISEVIARRSSGFPDLIWISLARDGGGAGETLAAAVNVIQMSLIYTRWSGGSHE